jgi:Phosphotransferase enzyme family
MSKPADRDAEVPLQVWGSGAQPSKARRRDGVVLRQAGPWSATVLALLRHLEEAGFAGAPRVAGSGFAADGREMLSYIPGASPQPYAWSEDAVAAVGVLLRELHTAAATFVPPPVACWKPWFGRDLAGSQPVIGHCDTGPWNIIARAGRPVALVDFEFAGPVDAIWELAQAAWLNAQLHDDDIAERFGLPDLASRGRQLRLILDGYGLPARQRRGFADKMIAFAVHSARAEAIESGVTAQTTAGITDSGYPFVWAITWRTRSASWMLTHRAHLQRAISGSYHRTR